MDKTMVVLDFREAFLKRNALEKRFEDRYGEEFVNDLKDAYNWMMSGMVNQPPIEVIARRRRNLPKHKPGEWLTVFYVDFENQTLIRQTLDNYGGRSVIRRAYHPWLFSDDNYCVRVLLSGLYLYDRKIANKWNERFLTDDEKIVCYKV